LQVGFSPDGKYLYFSINGENAIGKIEVATRTLVGKLSVGAGPIQFFVSPDNKYLVAANQGIQEHPSKTNSIIIDTASSPYRELSKQAKAHTGL
jgi:DNA-binding beta-propeller fold protein YncE